MEENTQESKLIFGLSPFATALNAILLTIISGLLNAVYFCTHFEENHIDWANTTTDNPWYITFPLFVIAWVMMNRYIDWRYEIAPNVISLKHFLRKIIYLTIFVIAESTCKVFFINNLISLI